MAKQNCWGFKKCMRGPGGAKVSELGACPAAMETKVNGIHDGKNSGRCCWVIAGTLCGGKAQGTFAIKALDCMNCDFYKQVKEEEGKNFAFTTKIFEKLEK